jgi:Fungal protein kinase
LKLAKERGVKGIAEWFHHEQITIDGMADTIAHLRVGLKFGAPRKLSGKSSWVDNSAESSREYSRTRSVTGRSRSSAARLTGLGIGTSSTSMSSGQKRKREEGFADGDGGVKRSRSVDDRTGNRNPGTTDVHSIQETEADSLAGCESETYGNRIYCCLVTSPAGRPLHSYRSVTAFGGSSRCYRG